MMGYIKTYSDMLKEGTGVSSFGDYNELLECIRVFVKTQDVNVSVKVNADDSFELSYSMNASKYKILGRVDNGDILITGVYMSSPKDVVSVNINHDSVKPTLDVHHLYDIVMEKMRRILFK